MGDLAADFGRFFEILPHLGLFLFPFQLLEPNALVFEIERIARLAQHAAHALNF